MPIIVHLHCWGAIYTREPLAGSGFFVSRRLANKLACVCIEQKQFRWPNVFLAGRDSIKMRPRPRYGASCKKTAPRLLRFASPSLDSNAHKLSVRVAVAVDWDEPIPHGPDCHLSAPLKHLFLADDQFMRASLFRSFKLSCLGDDLRRRRRDNNHGASARAQAQQRRTEAERCGHAHWLDFNTLARISLTQQTKIPIE